MCPRSEAEAIPFPENVMRVGSVSSALLVLLCGPSLAAAQETTSLAYQPSDAAVRLAVETPVAVPQDTVTTGSDDPYRVGTNSVVTGAVVGGIIGGTVVAIHTVGDNTREPLNWVAAVSAPIIGGLVGAGIGLIFR